MECKSHHQKGISWLINWVCRFRWAVCQLNSFQACRNLPTLREALHSLPNTLDETYSRILCDIPNEYSDYAVSILRWLAHAERPLRLAEIGEVIAVNLCGDPWFDADIRFPDPRDLLDILPGLLQVELSESENSVIRLAHFSVKEYLVSERIRTQRPQKFWSPEIQSHELIAATCLAYLLHFAEKDQVFMDIDTFSLKSLEKYPLMMYACCYWTRHARFANSHQGILNRLSLEFLRRSNLRKVWFRHFHSGPLLDSRMEEPEHIPPLFIAASVGVLSIVRSLLELAHDANEQCALGTALETAATQGHNSVLLTLLKYGADPNLLGRDGYPPLQAAARFGTVESVKALVDSGADIHDERGSFGSCLIAACVSSDYRSSVETSEEFLLDQGADVHIVSKIHGNALHATCAHYGANRALIEKLVSRGIDIDAPGGKYGTALQAACAHSRNDQVIRFLLSEADPCTEVQESKYGTALQAVCAETHDNDQIVQLLLDHGAKKNARGGKYGTALHAACYQGNEKIVRLLLEDRHNLDVDEVTANYGTPLHAACLGRRTKIVHVLVLELGANINVDVRRLGTPLHVACHTIRKHGTTIITRFLLAKGADVNVRRDRRPYTALDILLQDTENAGCQEILRILHEQSVNETERARPSVTDLEKGKKYENVLSNVKTEDEKDDTTAKEDESETFES